VGQRPTVLCGIAVVSDFDKQDVGFRRRIRLPFYREWRLPTDFRQPTYPNISPNCFLQKAPNRIEQSARWLRFCWI